MNTAELIAAQREREPRSTAIAEAKVAATTLHARPIEDALRKADRTPRPGKRIRLVLQAADAWADQLAPIAACRRGCDHCCHIPLAVTTAEARLLAQVSGRAMSMPASATPLQNLDEAMALRLSANGGHDAGPCPFLQAGMCSVYDHRPVACRTHFNPDDDELLCRVVPGHPANVPYANSVHIVVACLLRQPDESMADIREFFP